VVSPSKEFKIAVLLSPLKQYQIAQIAGIHPSTFSKMLSGAERIKRRDPRIIAVGRVIGIRPENCFDNGE